MHKKLDTKPLIICVVIALTSCADLNNGPYGGGGYGNDPYRGGSRYDDYDRHEDWRRERERRELDRERDRLDDERRRLEEERRRSAATPPPQQERCPAGFSPSEHKCSSDERRRGCKDMRMPGGLGCVRR